MHTVQNCRSTKVILYNTFSSPALCALGKARCMRSDEELSVCGIVVAPRCSGLSNTLDFRIGNSVCTAYILIIMYVCICVYILPIYHLYIIHAQIIYLSILCTHYQSPIIYHLPSQAPTYLYYLYIYYL